MTQSHTSFTYERDFSKNGIGKRSYDSAPQLPISHAEHIRQLEAMRLSSFTQGVEKGKAEQTTSDHSKLAICIEQISGMLSLHAQNLQQMDKKAHEEAVTFALLFARKLSGSLLDAMPIDAIEAAARAIFQDMRGSPHVAVRVNPSLVDACKERLEILFRNNGLESKLFVFPDPNITFGDCRIEWADGGIVRDHEKLSAQIEAAITTILPQKTSE